MRRHYFDIIFTLTLFALYTTIALSLSTIGAQVYTNTAQTLSSNFDQRTSVLYVTQKLRQNDVSGLIRVEQLGDGDALVFTEVYEDQSYETWFYVADGFLREVLMLAGDQPDANYGQAIMPMQSMAVDSQRLSDGVLTISFIQLDGSVSVVDIHLQSLNSEQYQGALDER
ncbi:MAG: DUF4860 domain-containing protein [Coriobacteriales bacterium]|jgi:hypothetical protein|nr:DUF4860 domain-containing protein [Coriobacteriales bacterium]